MKINATSNCGGIYFFILIQIKNYKTPVSVMLFIRMLQKEVFL